MTDFITIPIGTVYTWMENKHRIALEILSDNTLCYERYLTDNDLERSTNRYSIGKMKGYFKILTNRKLCAGGNFGTFRTIVNVNADGTPHKSCSHMNVKFPSDKPKESVWTPVPVLKPGTTYSWKSFYNNYSVIIQSKDTCKFVCNDKIQQGFYDIVEVFRGDSKGFKLMVYNDSRGLHICAFVYLNADGTPHKLHSHVKLTFSSVEPEDDHGAKPEDDPEPPVIKPGTVYTWIWNGSLYQLCIVAEGKYEMTSTDPTLVHEKGTYEICSPKQGRYSFELITLRSDLKMRRWFNLTKDGTIPGKDIWVR